VQEGKLVQDLVYIVRGSGDITIGDRRIGSLESQAFATSLSCLLPHTKPPAPNANAEDSKHSHQSEEALDLSKVFSPLTHSHVLTQPSWLRLVAGSVPHMSIMCNPSAQVTALVTSTNLSPTQEQLKAEGIASPRRSNRKRPSTHKTARDKYRSTASTRLTSPDGYLLVIPLHAVRELLESDPGLEKPLLSLAAAETASRLNLTQRRVQRLQRYKQRLHAATSGVYRVPSNRQKELAEYAARHGISEEEHGDALRSVGWTPAEWADGYSSTAFRAITAKQMQHATGFVTNALQAAASLFAAPAQLADSPEEDDDDEDDDDDEGLEGDAREDEKVPPESLKGIGLPKLAPLVDPSGSSRVSAGRLAGTDSAQVSQDSRPTSAQN